MASVGRLAQRGAVWPRAMSTSSWTLPALASLQTGLMPAAHGAGCLEEGHCQGLSPEVRPLAEELGAAGWVTAAVVSNPWVGAGTGFDRGFDYFFDSGRILNRLVIGGAPRGLHRQDDARTVDEALAWLEGAPRRGFYLWVHLLGPHMPYHHSPNPSMQTIDPVALRSAYPPSETQKRIVRDAYAGEVAYSDRQVMRLLDALEARGVLDDGVVVLTADHGEELWDHGGIEHGHSHHGEVVDVSLVLVAPGVVPGERPGVASLLDVAPTLRAIAGLPPRGLDLRAGVPAARTATAWGGLILHLDCSARAAGRRVIARDCSHDADKVRVYDLARDPLELAPMPWEPDDPLVQSAWAVQAPGRGAASNLPVDRLRALGYLQ
jgi:arylsulfatase A-like enzyme